MVNRVLIAGATGRTGRLIVDQLMVNGNLTHVLVRDLISARELFGEKVHYHVGDVRQIETLYPSMADVDVVISAVGTSTPVGKNCPKNVDYQGVANLVDAALNQDIKRFILVSSIAVTQTEHPLNRFGRVLDWKLKGEEVLRSSGLEYAIIRPGCLLDTPAGIRKLYFDQGDRLVGTVSRGDVALTCLNALQYQHVPHVTFEVFESENYGNNDWTSLFLSLTPD